MTLKHAVDPLMEAVSKLYGGRVPQICSGMGEYFRDVFDHLQRLHATIEGIRDMQTTAIQVNLGMISLNETEVTKKLAGWAAIIAVPTMIAGIYGMNFKNMPELEWVWGYPVSVAVMVADRHLALFPVQEDQMALTWPRSLALSERSACRCSPPASPVSRACRTAAGARSAAA